MRTYRFLGPCALVALALAVPAVALTRGDAGPARRHFLFTYSATVKDVPAGAKEAHVWIPLPNEHAAQHARLVDVVAPVKGEETRESKYGNAMLHFRLPKPAATFTVTASYDVARTEVGGSHFRGLGNEPLGDDDRKSLALFLQANKLVPVTGRPAEMAGQIVGEEKNS